MKEQTLNESINDFLTAVDDLVEDIVKNKCFLFRWYLRRKHKKDIINGTLGELAKQNFNSTKPKLNR